MHACEQPRYGLIDQWKGIPVTRLSTDLAVISTNSRVADTRQSYDEQMFVSRRCGDAYGSDWRDRTYPRIVNLAHEDAPSRLPGAPCVRLSGAAGASGRMPLPEA